MGPIRQPRVAVKAVPMTNDEIDKAAGHARSQLLTFRLGASTYGVDILRVKEIRGWSPVTRIPHSPQHVLGVLNLRGAIIPIIDLRLRFGLPDAGFSPLTVIIVLSVSTPAGHRDCGVVVDSVSDVVDVPPDSVKPAPSLKAGESHDFIGGIATIDEQMLILLNVDELVTRDLTAGAAAAAA
jgi:purine-binding chemotaxis protein CheW